MTAETRGSWLLDRAINARWDDRGLDARFRDYQQDVDAVEYEPLNDTEARPTPPGPYCVYEKGTPTVLGHSGGTTPTTERQYLRVPLQFTIHAKSTATASGKEIVTTLAKLVAAAFDPENEALCMEPDAHVNTFRGPDFCIREGEDEWAWVLMFDVEIDATYNTPQSQGA